MVLGSNAEANILIESRETPTSFNIFDDDNGDYVHILAFLSLISLIVCLGLTSF